MAQQFEERWGRVRVQLEEARVRLTRPDDEALLVYAEFLGRSELGLALDVLAEVALAQRAPGEVWRALNTAVRSMELGPDDSVHGSTVAMIVERSSAADAWQGLRRLVNEWDPIGVRPGHGWPDDEYECLIPPLMGRLTARASATEIADFLRRELSRHFGLNPAYSKPEAFATTLVEWFVDQRQT